MIWKKTTSTSKIDWETIAEKSKPGYIDYYPEDGTYRLRDGDKEQLQIKALKSRVTELEERILKMEKEFAGIVADLVKELSRDALT